MRRKVTILGTLAILLIAALAGISPAYRHSVSTLRGFERNFQHNFGELRQAGSMNPLERFVFSILLSNAKAPSTAGTNQAPVGRT